MNHFDIYHSVTLVNNLAIVLPVSHIVVLYPGSFPLSMYRKAPGIRIDMLQTPGQLFLVTRLQNSQNNMSYSASRPLSFDQHLVNVHTTYFISFAFAFLSFLLSLLLFLLSLLLALLALLALSTL